LKKPLPSTEVLRSAFNYDPDTGVATWNAKFGNAHWNTKFAGKVVGSLSPRGYLRTQIDGVEYQLHRLIWKHYYGSDPLDEIDHCNQIKVDNRIENLREATRSQNAANRPVKKRDGSNVRGATYHAGKWQSYCTINGHNTYLGRFSTPEEAHKAYVEAVQSSFKEFAYTGDVTNQNGSMV